MSTYTINVVHNGETFSKHGHLDISLGHTGTHLPSHMGTHLLGWLKASNLDNLKNKLSLLTPVKISKSTKFTLIETEFNDMQALEAFHKLASLETPMNYLSYFFANADHRCEWGYVIDLDQETFEIYKGRNKQPLKETDRFYSLNAFSERLSDKYYPTKFFAKYYPVKLFAKYSLDNLPTPSDFLSDIDYLEKFSRLVPNSWIPDDAIDFTKERPAKIFKDLFNFNPIPQNITQSLKVGKRCILHFKDKVTSGLLEVSLIPLKLPQGNLNGEKPYVYSNVELRSFTSDIMPDQNIFDLIESHNINKTYLEDMINIKINT